MSLITLNAFEFARFTLTLSCLCDGLSFSLLQTYFMPVQETVCLLNMNTYLNMYFALCNVYRVLKTLSTNVLY